jgi:heme/copper-type cytochrome/quinol oxidase subunit 2
MNDPYSSGGDPTAAIMGMMGGMMLIWLVVIAFAIFCYWKIFAKAGYSGALSLLLLVPIANLIVVVWFAFADWPVLKRLRGEVVP